MCCGREHHPYLRLDLVHRHYGHTHELAHSVGLGHPRNPASIHPATHRAGKSYPYRWAASVSRAGGVRLPAPSERSFGSGPRHRPAMLTAVENGGAWHRYSSGGSWAPIKEPLAPSTCRIISTNSRFASIAGPRVHGASCSTVCFSRQSKYPQKPTSISPPTTTSSRWWTDLDN